jgi:glyoxylase-like metal-dependent hydrolase (beta-lactamase superfamily II)
MKLYALDTGIFRLDGGAMFGVVPRVVWEKTNPADSRNRIRMAMRCLLIESDGRLVLVDTGIGHKEGNKFNELYALEDEHTLTKSLARAGFSPDDVTDVVLTHLHFDHCGGGTELDADGKPQVAFRRARYWLQRRHLDWALHPNARETASFFAANIQPLVESGQLELLDTPAFIASGRHSLIPGVELITFDGHTAGQQLPLIQHAGKQWLFAADLFPTWGHIPLPYVMGYDTRPLLTLDERQVVLPWLLNEQVVLIYGHDADHECGLVTRDERGKYRSGDTYLLSE